jgi:hypothetical protein
MPHKNSLDYQNISFVSEKCKRGVKEFFGWNFMVTIYMLNKQISSLKLTLPGMLKYTSLIIS